MKSRATLLFLALLLMMGFVTSAAMADSATAAVAAPALTEGEAMTPAVTSPDCSKSALPIFAPAPTDQAFTNCGTCSDTICQGLPLHTVCGFKNGATYRCQAVLGDTCGQGSGTWQCTCWTGPLP